MTIKETTLVFSILTAAYPYFYRDIRHDENQMADAIAVWHEMIGDYDLVTVKVALKRLIAIQKEYPPTIGQLLESINIVSGHAAPDADEVWTEIINAIGRYGYSRAVEAIEALSEFARQAVKVFGWDMLCKSENIEADRAHFLRVYQAIKTRNDQKYILPKDVRAFIAAHDSFSIPKDKPDCLTGLDTPYQLADHAVNMGTLERPCTGATTKNGIESILSQLRKPRPDVEVRARPDTAAQRAVNATGRLRLEEA